MDDVQRALEKAAEALPKGQYSLCSLVQLPCSPECSCVRDMARAAVLAFLKEMPIKVISESAHMTITRDWSVPEMIAAIEKEQP